MIKGILISLDVNLCPLSECSPLEIYHKRSISFKSAEQGNQVMRCLFLIIAKRRKGRRTSLNCTLVGDYDKTVYA